MAFAISDGGKDGGQYDLSLSQYGQVPKDSEAYRSHKHWTSKGRENCQQQICSAANSLFLLWEKSVNKICCEENHGLHLTLTFYTNMYLNIRVWL